MVFLLTLPSCVGLMVLGKSMIGAIYEGPKFQAYDTRQTALAMGGSAAFAGRADSGRAQHTAESLAAQREAFDLAELLTQVMVVEAGIGGAGQLQDAIAHVLRQAAGAGSPAAGVCQSGLPALPIARLESFDMPRC